MATPVNLMQLGPDTLCTPALRQAEARQNVTRLLTRSEGLLLSRFAVLAVSLLCTPVAVAQTRDAHPLAGNEFGEAIAMQALEEAERRGDRYAVDNAVHLPWRDEGQPREHTKGQWKCNVFALNKATKSMLRTPPLKGSLSSTTNSTTNAGTPSAARAEDRRADRPVVPQCQ